MADPIEMQNPKRSGLWRWFMWGGLACLLALPAVAMRFTTEVQWTASDFVFAGIVFAVAGGVVEVIMTRSQSLLYRAGAGLTLLTSILLLWVTGAVGIIGSENHPSNQLYLALIGGVILGSLIVRCRANGMALVTLLAAVAQATIGGAALLNGWGVDGASWPRDVIGATGLFSLLWLGAAIQFRDAGRSRA